MPTSGKKSSGTLYLAGLALGTAAVITGMMWSTLVKPSTVWSDAQAAEFKAANDALHSIREQKGSAVAAPTPAMLAAQQRFQRINDQLEAAQYAHDRWGTKIAAGGLVVILACGLGLMMTRGASADDFKDRT